MFGCASCRQVHRKRGSAFGRRSEFVRWSNGRNCVHALIDRVRGEYREMPGLKLTVAQACRLSQLDRLTCEAMLEQLIHEEFLHQTPSGAYIALPVAARPIKAALDGPPVARRRA